MQSQSYNCISAAHHGQPPSLVRPHSLLGLHRDAVRARNDDSCRHVQEEAVVDHTLQRVNGLGSGVRVLDGLLGGEGSGGKGSGEREL